MNSAKASWTWWEERRRRVGPAGVAHEGEQDIAREQTGFFDDAGRVLGHLAQFLPGGCGTLALALEDRLNHLEDLSCHLGEQGVLAGEVVEEGRLGDVGRLGDFVDGGGLETLLQEKHRGGVVDARVELSLLAFASALGCRGRHGSASLLFSKFGAYSKFGVTGIPHGRFHCAEECTPGVSTLKRDQTLYGFIRLTSPGSDSHPGPKLHSSGHNRRIPGSGSDYRCRW